MWRPAPTSPWRTQHVPPQRYRRRLTAPRQRRTLSKLASSMAHLTIYQPPWRCTGTTKGMWVSDRCARVRRHGNGQPTCEPLVKLVLGLVGFGPRFTSSLIG